MITLTSTANVLELKNKGAISIVSPVEFSFNIRQFVNSHNAPYCLPGLDAFAWSLPYVFEKGTQFYCFFRLLIFIFIFCVFFCFFLFFFWFFVSKFF